MSIFEKYGAIYRIFLTSFAISWTLECVMFFCFFFALGTFQTDELHELQPRKLVDDLKVSKACLSIFSVLESKQNSSSVSVVE